MDLPIKNSVRIKNLDIGKCIHARKLIQMVDIENEDPRIQFFVKHSKNCSDCQKTLKDIERTLVRFEFFIPKPKVNAELKNDFEIELKHVFKNTGMSLDAKLKIKKIKSFDIFQAIIRDVETVLNNKKIMILAVAIAGCGFGILNLLLK